MSTKVSRRNFLKLTGAAVAATMLSANKFTALAQDNSLNVELRSISIPTSAELITSLIKYWGKTNKIDVKLSLLSRPQLTQALMDAVKNGTGPDVLQTTYLQAYGQADMMVDITDICEAIGSANGGWYDFARESCVVDGKWVAMPHFFTPLGMVYRKDLFKQAGIDTLPKTWDDMLKVGTKLKAMGKPLGLSLGHSYGDGVSTVFSLLWSFGGSVTDENGKVNLDSPATKQAVEFMQQLTNDAMLADSWGWDDPDNNKSFLKGDISFTMNPASILWTAQTDRSEFLDQIDHFPFPAGPAGTFLSLEVHNLSIPKYSKNIEKAKQLLSYLNSPQMWTPLLPTTFTFDVPLLKAYEDRPDMPWNSNPKLTAYKGEAPLGRVLSYPSKPSARASALSTNLIISDMFINACTGKATADDAIKQATQALKAEYQEA